MFVGGWEGPRPQAFCDWATDLLEGQGFDVETHETLTPLADALALPNGVSSDGLVDLLGDARPTPLDDAIAETLAYVGQPAD